MVCFNTLCGVMTATVVVSELFGLQEVVEAGFREAEDLPPPLLMFCCSGARSARLYQAAVSAG